jgi:hypothetical protein
VEVREAPAVKESALTSSTAEKERISQLESEVSGLHKEVSDLKRQFADFRKQFE